MARRKPKINFNTSDLDRYGIDLDRYCMSIARSRKVLERYRVERREAVRQNVGAHYSDDGSRVRVPVNLIGLYESIIGTSLLSANPQYMLSTFQDPMKPAVSTMQDWINPQVRRMRLAQSLRRIIDDGLYCIGIGKVSLASPTDAATLAWGVRAGEPLLSPIDLDDWVYDTQAHRFEEVAFEAHRFRVPIDAVKDSRHYTKSVTKKLNPSPQQRYNREGDERIGQLGTGLWWHQDDAEDMIDLWEVYLPRHRLVITLADEAVLGPSLVTGELGAAEPLRAQHWIGPDQGPYHHYLLKTVAGNAMPQGPIMDLVDLHLEANSTFRQLADQARRQKTNIWYQRGQDGDAKRIADAPDGQAIGVDRPDQIKETRLGGPDQQNLLFFQMVQQLFSWRAGNLDILGGLSPQAKTLGQDKLLNANSSRVISGMQQQTLTFVEQVGRALCWYWWHDPFTVMEAPYSPQGAPEVSVGRSLHPASPEARRAGQLTRHGDFEQIDLQVDPYSLVHQTPQERLQALDQMVQTIIIPLMPLLQQRGITFDVMAYLRLKARYQNMPELQEIVTIGQAVPAAGEEPGGELGQPAQTERHYVRENRSERTQQGTTQNLLTHLGGMNPGGNETASGAPRPAG